MDNKELQEFWEWCGIRYEPDQDCFKVIFPDGEWYNFGQDWKMGKTEPELDLNNLFKDAVPRLKDYIEQTWVLDPVNAPYQLFLVLQQWITDIAYKESDPAPALYQVIQKARRKDK